MEKHENASHLALWEPAIFVSCVLSSQRVMDVLDLCRRSGEGGKMAKARGGRGGDGGGELGEDFLELFCARRRG